MRATKPIFVLIKENSHQERLHCLNLTKLEMRRFRGDVIELFKVFKGAEKWDSLKFF